jgi:predicted Zn-dependent protease
MPSAPAKAQEGIPLIRDDEIEQLVTDYARPILRAAGLDQGAIEMRLVNNKQFNAFVLDGRSIYIHIGTLMQSETPNQAIGVIAHETGHIDGAHVAAMRSRMAREQTKLLLLRLLGIGAAIMAKSGEAIVAGDEVVIRGFLAERRQQESAADQAGLKYLTITRQSGRGMLETFDRLREQNRAFGGVNPYLLSHPTEANRIAQLREAAERSPYFNAKDAPELQERHNLMRAKLYGFTAPAMDVSRIYPATDNSLAARYARAIAANCSGNCARGVGQIDALIKDRPNNPYFWELKGHVLTKEARYAEAVPAFRRAVQIGGNKVPLVKLELAKTLVELNDPKQLDEAIRILEVTLETQQEEASSFDMLARAYAGRNQIPEAELATARAHMARGNRNEAVIFAKRAQARLQPGTRAWLKADDIIKIGAKERY